MTATSVRLKNLIRVHYGKALKKAERIETGPHSVFGSRGEVGKHTHRLVDYPTLIVGRKGSVGAVTYAPDGGWPIDTAFYVERLDADALDLRYLFYALRRCRLEERVITTSIPGLSRDDIYSARIPLPPLPEQRRIAAILDKADAVRRKRQQTLDLADQFLRSAFLDLFGDPVTNPKCWPVKKLDDLCLGISDIDHKMPKAVDSGIPFISAKDLADDGSISFKDVKQISKDDFNRLARKGRPRKGDIIYSRIGANLGKARLVEVDFDFLASYSCCTIKPRGALIDKHFLCYLLDSPFTLRQALGGVRAIAVPDLGLGMIKAFKIITPPLPVQRHFAAVVESLEKQKARRHAHLSELDALFASLRQRAFRGELLQSGVGGGRRK
jgi:type I restriction enzyme S subunit